jgi:membrane protease YdiL (CAAX protease family)
MYVSIGAIKRDQPGVPMTHSPTSSGDSGAAPIQAPTVSSPARTTPPFQSRQDDVPAPQPGTIAFTSPPAASWWQRWFLFSPAARLALFVLLMVGFGFAVHAVADGLGWSAKDAAPLQQALARLSLQLIPAGLGYLILVRWIERRRMRELDVRDIRTFGVGGLLLGFVLFSAVVGVLWLAGSYHVNGFNDHVNWAYGLLVAGIGAGIGEEIVMRGVLFRVIEEGMGTWWALVISAAFFGFAHAFNPGATLWSSVAIMIEAGVLLALLYHVTRSLWACIGLHAAWNITQGLIYGVAVSGGHAEGWLDSTLTGPDWLSGGAFGAEASVVTVLMSLALSAYLLSRMLRRGSVVAPGWRRGSSRAA